MWWWRNLWPRAGKLPVTGHQRRAAALQAAVDAVKRACTATDREKFRDALAQTKLEALAGTVAFDSPRSVPNGENQGGAVIISRITGRESYEMLK